MAAQEKVPRGFRSLVQKIVLVALVLSFPLFPPSAQALDHFDFAYPDRASLFAAGWSYQALTAAGSVRDTEQTSGAVVSYDQGSHTLRIPADVGDLWQNLNDTRNSLFRAIPSDWTSLRLKLSFAPTRNYQQAGLLVYQDDDNYVQICRIFENGNLVTFAHETRGAANILASAPETGTSNLVLRLERDPATEQISALYSLDGVNWRQLGSVVHALRNPRLAVVVGASPSGFPNAELIFAEVGVDPPASTETLSLLPSNLLFTAVAGAPRLPSKTVSLMNSGATSLAWEQRADAPWLTVTPSSGSTPSSLTVAVDNAGLSSGVYAGSIAISAPRALNPVQPLPVTLVVNPNVPVKASVWKDGLAAALSVSVDDGDSSCFTELQRNGFKGTYFTNGVTPPLFYTDYYKAGMELGSHLTNHVCGTLTDEELRYEGIEPNIQGICTGTPEPCSDVISLAWPCGYTERREEPTAADYFLSARGYNFNLLEDPTPVDFMNLKSFNSHEHVPYPPADLKTVVDQALQQGRWANLVFHTACNDDGAIDYAAGKPIWVAPIGTVVKYILQRDRMVVGGYQDSAAQTQFSVSRVALPSSPVRGFDNAVGAGDVVTVQVDVDDTRTVAQVLVDGTAAPYQIKTVNGNKILFFNTLLSTVARPVTIAYQNLTTPTITLSPTSVAFATVQGSAPAGKTLSVSNSGGGTLTWSASVDAATPSWLSVAPSSGSGNASLALSVDSAALPPGTYAKKVTVSAAGATNTPQSADVTLTVSPKPAIALSPTTLSFTAVEKSSPPAQTVSLTNGGGGTLVWSATADSTAPAWLSVQPSGGSGAATLSVSVSSAALPPATYRKTITVAADGASNSPQAIPVTLTVTPLPPTISLSPVTLSFTAAEGTTPPAKSIAIGNSGGGTLVWNATADTAAPAWLSVAPASGTGAGTLTVTASAAGMRVGNYSKTITVTAAGATNSPQKVKVTLKVTRK